MAPSAYVLAPVLWVLALLATEVRGARARTRVAALVAAWIVVVGPPPPPDRADLLVNLFCQAEVVILGVALVWRPRPWRRSLRVTPESRLATAAE